MARVRTIIVPEEANQECAALHDLRFSALVGAAAWSRLPAAVRARFSKRLAPDAAVTYVGTIV